MNLKEAAEVLRKHNDWRRSCGNELMANPTVLGTAIDVLVDHANQSPYPVHQVRTAEEVIEELAHKCFVYPTNKEGEGMTVPVGGNPKGWRKHLSSFKKGYLAYASQCSPQVGDKFSREDMWVSVKDRLPEFNKTVLAISNKGKIEFSFVDSAGKLDEFQLEIYNGKQYYTHWQPLPSPPNQ